MRGKRIWERLPWMGLPGGNGRQYCRRYWLPGPLATEDHRAAGRREVRAPGPSPPASRCAALEVLLRAAARALPLSLASRSKSPLGLWEACWSGRGFRPEPLSLSPRAPAGPCSPSAREDPGAGRGATERTGLRLLSLSFEIGLLFSI